MQTTPRRILLFAAAAIAALALAAWLERGGGDEGVRRREAGRLERGGGDEGVRRREAAWLERGGAAGAWRRAA